MFLGSSKRWRVDGNCNTSFYGSSLT